MDVLKIDSNAQHEGAAGRQTWGERLRIDIVRTVDRIPRIECDLVGNAEKIGFLVPAGGILDPTAEKPVLIQF